MNGGHILNATDYLDLLTRKLILFSLFANTVMGLDV